MHSTSFSQRPSGSIRRLLWSLGPLLVFLLAASGLFSAGELTAKGLTLTQFDTAGVPVRRLKAERAEGPLDSAQLHRGEVEFYRRPKSNLPPDVNAPWARLTFPLARYSALEKRVQGPGPLRLATPEANLDGRHFDYRLENNRLVLTEAVTLSAQGVTARCPRAEVQLAEGAQVDNPGVERAELSGGVVVTGLVLQGKVIDRVEAPSVIYFGQTSTIQLRSPVWGWSGGVRTEMSGNELTYQLKRTP
ncbi:MAG: hypothetical protein JNN01_20875 [Opitutaceae bacterium]|nr:hypothetical protein [Opitutaceae bacterium]